MMQQFLARSARGISSSSSFTFRKQLPSTLWRHATSLVHLPPQNSDANSLASHHYQQRFTRSSIADQTSILGRRNFSSTTTYTETSPTTTEATKAAAAEDDEDSDLEGASGPLLDFSDDKFPSPPSLIDQDPVCIVDSKSNNNNSNNKNDYNDEAVTELDGSEIYSALEVEPLAVPEELMARIERQEWDGGRMKAAQHGVLHEDPKVDMRLLMENYSVASLASALRDREDVLQQCATLAGDGDFETLQKVLRAFHPQYLIKRRKRKRQLDVCKPLTTGSLEVIRKALMRMPRTVTTAHTQRAGVVIPLCISNGVPSLLLEKRSPDMRNHPDEVCLPGGMVCDVNDATIISTCLREMKEEIPGLDMGNVEVLGVLRCNWGEVHHLVGVAVTPVVCYLGEISDDLHHNSDEVAKVFTIPLSNLLKSDLWVQKQDLAPIFVGGPEIIWGLTGYILERFVKDIVLPNHIRKDHHLQHHSLRNI